MGVLLALVVLVVANDTVRYVFGHHALVLILLLLVGIGGLVFCTRMIVVLRRQQAEWGEPGGADWIAVGLVAAVGLAALVFGAHLTVGWYDDAKIAVKFEDEIPGYIETADAVAPGGGRIEHLGATKASKFAPPAAVPASLAGPAVVVDPGDAAINDGIFFSLPEQAQASSPDEAVIVAFIGYEDHKVGTYEGGGVAFRESAEVVVLDLRSKAIVGTRTIWGGMPPPTTRQGADEWGSPPKRQKIVDYIAGFTAP